ncbi:MAG: Rrf2 family transcriptional regulator [Phycisphaerales bacterium]|nr:MAG: Rrf2 family transcriptional regulator [Phycisphaerales bacterium]
MVDWRTRGGDVLSLTSEYAMRAVVYLARCPDEGPLPGRRIAAALNIPPKYLSTLLRELVRCGVLEASPGKSGGFQLARPAEEVRLHEVVAPFEAVAVARKPCPFGNATCSDEHPCDGHRRWKRVTDELRRFLDETTVQDLARPRRRRASRPARRDAARAARPGPAGRTRRTSGATAPRSSTGSA